MQNKDKYLLYLLKGKCYDKKKQFKQAILQYEQARALTDSDEFMAETKGQIEFRLGWSIVRSK